MRVEGRATVPLPLEEAWRRINDPEVIRRCTPGLERLEETRTDHFDATIDLALPAIQGTFNGSVDFEERVEPERLHMRLSGKGAPGFVEGTAQLELAACDAGTEFRYLADVQVGGSVARVGQRMLSGVVKEMAGQFFEALGRSQTEDGAPVSAPGPLASFAQLVWRLLLRLVGIRRD